MNRKINNSIGSAQAVACLEYISGEVWAILPEKMGSMVACLQDIAAGASFTSAVNEKGYTVQGGTAIIDISGPITRHSNFFTMLFGGASIDTITRDLAIAIADDSVEQIVLNIDSPGGTVSGVDDLSTLIYESRGEKPIAAYTGGMMASAAYWIGSAADTVAASKTALVGSIGAVMRHLDASSSYTEQGLNYTHIVSAPYKAVGNDAGPLDTKGKEYYQSIVDDLHKIFSEAVGRNRGMDPKKVAVAASGKVYLATEAVSLGLIDTVGTMGVASQKLIHAGGASSPPKANNKEEIMTLSELKEKNPEIVSAIQTEARTGYVLVEDLNASKAETQEAKAALDKSSTINAELVKAAAESIKVVSDAKEASIVSEVLADSTISEGLHSKVEAQVSAEDHTVDGKLDAVSFKTAFVAEVKDWEEKLGTSVQAVGLGDDTGTGSVDADIKLGQEMAREVVGKIRSDK